MKVTKVLLVKDDPAKGQRLATATVAFDSVVVVSGFSIFPDRNRPGKLRVLFPARRVAGDTIETFSILDPELKGTVVKEIEKACGDEGIKVEASGGNSR